MTILPRTDTNERQGRQSNCIRANSYSIQVAKSNFRNGGANLPVCRDDPQVVAHHFGNFFWQSLYKSFVKPRRFRYGGETVAQRTSIEKELADVTIHSPRTRMRGVKALNVEFR